MGCVGGGKEDCSYWVHPVCKGFADASEEEIESLNFYCPKHNERASQMKNKSMSKGTRKVRTRGGRRGTVRSRGDCRGRVRTRGERQGGSETIKERK